MRKSFRKAILLGAISVASPAAGQDGLFGIFSQKPSPTSPPTSRTTPVKDDAVSESRAPFPRPVATRLSTFSIPIAASSLGDGVKEIQLHVSADQGKTWHLYYRVGPTDKFFPFKAAADGEYWFATRVIDSASKPVVDSDLRPEMRVMIDTTPPRLKLTTEMSPSGEVIAKWQATDPMLSNQSLKLEYQTSPTGQWRSIVIPSSGIQKKDGGLTGQVSWLPREATGSINLRAEILDQAGNHAVALDRLEPGAIARGVKPLEPPIAGPATAPQQDGAKREGALASVSNWLGGTLGGGAKKSATPEDPYASTLPSDTFAGSEPSANSAAEGQKKPSSRWATSGSELTDTGIRRIPASRGEKPIEKEGVASEELARHHTEKRGPGKLASASTVREPKRETENEFEEQDSELRRLRPAIQPPENSQKEPATERQEGDQNEIPAIEAEEIPPPRPESRPQSKPEPRMVPADRAEQSAPPEPESPKQIETNRDRAVESLPQEGSREPIPSAPRKKPGEYRVRSPITSGLKGDERGVARPPAAAPYRSASATRDTIESTTESGRLPAGVVPIYTNRIRFGLEYDVNTVGSSGVSEVELWATRDGGQSWSRWGSDPDRRSPFDVEVDGEGAFGFRIVVLSRGGLASRPPQPGDDADQWVVVDTTVPKVALRGAGYGSDERVGQLEISWDAQDANMTEKSVSLFYSDREEGPWTRIVSDLANQGEYFWRVDSRVPPKIFIKVEVRDGAGNLAADQTREGIGVEGLVPSGKIRRIIPRDAE